jgi:hypothetical protein
MLGYPRHRDKDIGYRRSFMSEVRSAFLKRMEMLIAVGAWLEMSPSGGSDLDCSVPRTISKLHLKMLLKNSIWCEPVACTVLMPLTYSVDVCHLLASDTDCGSARIKRGK